jgi:hypothetical protein
MGEEHIVKEYLKDVLIYDLETAGNIYEGPEKQILRAMGAYEFNTNKYYFLTNKDEMKKLFQNNKYLIGFNNIGYSFKKETRPGFDNAVLAVNGFGDMLKCGSDKLYRFKKKINIDLLAVTKKRDSAIKVKNGQLDRLLVRYTLDDVTKAVGIIEEGEGKIKDFDYNILQKLPEQWSIDEYKQIYDYTLRDVKITKELYEFFENYFFSFREFVSQKDVDEKKYISCSTAVLSYKAICKELNIKEEYGNEPSVPFGGGYTSYPSDEHIQGNIYCLDVNSMYPSCIHQNNLFTTAEVGWNGGGKFKVMGTYNDKEKGKVEKLIQKWYEQRLEYKKQKNPKEYALKILLNAQYGILSSPMFKSIYNPTGGADVTRICRQWIRLARQRYREAGYKIIYTDSVGEESNIWIRQNKKISYISFKELFKFAKKTNNRERYYLNGIETISMNKNFKNSWKPIKYIFRHENIKKCFKLYQNNYEPLIVTEDHSLINIQNNQLCKVKPNETNTCILNNGINQIRKNIKLNPEMIFFGAWIGDGSYNHDGINMSTGIDFNDFNKKLFKKIFKHKKWRLSKSRLGDCSIYNPIFMNDMKAAGFIGDCFTKRIPDFIFELDISDRCSFLNGLFSSDGTICNRLGGSIIRYTTVNQELAEDIRRLLMSVGISTSIIKETISNHYKGKNNHTYSHHVKVCSLCNDYFMKHIGFFINRKKKKYIKTTKRNRYASSHFIKKEEIDYDGYVYDIEVEDTHNFYANNILVHNTDSVYLVDIFNDEKKLLGVKDSIIAEIKSAVPFPYEKFDMGIDARISDMWFFKGTAGKKESDSEMDLEDLKNKSKQLMKKNYVIRKNDGAIVVKNLGVSKRSISAISKTIFWDHLVKRISEVKKVKFSEAFLKDLINSILEKNISLAAIRYTIKDMSSYKLDSQLQAQISKIYGPGIHFMIPISKEVYDANHNILTAGKDKKYISVENFEKYKLKITDINLENVWAELAYFIQDSQTLLSSFFG